MRSLLISAACAFLAAGCSSQGVVASTSAGPATDVSACLADLGDSRPADAGGLDLSGFSVVNWNIQKGRDDSWVADLKGVNATPDLLILQEASPGGDVWDSLVPDHHRSFAEGFGFGQRVTGAVTASTARPISECSLVAFEPWFGTRKATLVTEYALQHSPATLLVVNIHSVNFTFGVRHMQEQLLEAAAIIEQHEGPVLFSGDFNTWHGRRARVVRDVVSDLGLVALEYDFDHRKRMFGWALDHIYVRGLDTVYSTSVAIGSSDHNPMAARFRLVSAQKEVKATL
jgi:endonuclease/exonuclease/phosphatase (EEP) superfamily protein YafD